VLGYCLFPLNLASLIMLFGGKKAFPGILQFGIVMVAFAWATFASIGFIS